MDRARVEKILSQFPEKTILIVGDVMLDEFIWGKVGRISPDYYCMDGTIPRSKLPLVLTRMAEMSKRFGLKVANVFHAGDGNLHPLILYDANQPGEMERAEAFGADILRCCVELGGALVEVVGHSGRAYGRLHALPVDQPTVGEPDDAVGEGHHQRVVGGDDRRHALRLDDGPQQRHDGRPGLAVQLPGGFVGDEQAG